MKSDGVASNWEFRWRTLLLIGSQPILAGLVHWASGSDRVWYSPEFSPQMGWLAVTVAMLGILLRVQATTALHARVMASDDPDTSRFVVHGIYRSVRNPLYLSSLLLFGGYALFFGVSWAVGFVAFHAWRYRRIVRLEESCLRTKWGGEFETYCHTVPRWWPRWREFRSEFGHWLSSQGVLSNAPYVAMWLGLVVSTVQRDLFWVIPFELGGGIVLVAYSRATSRVGGPELSSSTESIRLAAPMRHGSQVAVAEVFTAPHFSQNLDRAVSQAEDVR